MRADRLEHGAVGGAGIFELVGEHVEKALADLRGDVGSVCEQLAELEHQVAPVEAPGLAQDPVVAGEQVGELDLALGALALGRRGRGPLRGNRPVAQGRRRHRLGLQEVDAAQQPREQPGRVAADLVAPQRQVVEAVEQDREAVGRRDRGEERVEPGLGRVLAQQILGSLLVGAHPELLVGTVEEDLGAIAQPGTGGP